MIGTVAGRMGAHVDGGRLRAVVLGLTLVALLLVGARPAPAAAAAWPGGADVAVADDAGVLGSNLSGLAYQPATAGSPAVLWAVRNGPSTLFRLIRDGATWKPDTANDWGAGKTLVFPGGGGVPDAEGVTLAGGDPGAVFVSVERDDSPGVKNTSRPGVLRYDVTAAGTTLTATRDWNLTADLPGLGNNDGLEALTWVPDDVLVAKGFLDEGTGAAYSPAAHPNHGTGLFFVGVEQDGRIIAYALDQTADTATRVAGIDSGFGTIMDLAYEPETTHLWAVCDDHCSGQTKTLDIAQSGVDDGKFVVTNTYDRPAGMANLNNEGFTIAPQSECVGGFKPVFWADDSNDAAHALRSGTLACPVPGGGGGGAGGGGAGGGGAGGGGGGGGAGAPAGPPAGSGTPVGGTTPTPPDRTAPKLTVGLKLSAAASRTLRRTGKLSLVLTLGERADLTITAAARKNVRAPKRTILRATRRGIAAGRRTLVLTLSRTARLAVRKGATVSLTIAARDAAGNTTTRRLSAKVK